MKEVQETTTVSDDTPQHVVRTTKVIEPALEEKNPKQVYEQKKTLFRFSQIVWYILGIIETFIAFRVLLKLLGANPFTGFANFVYTVTWPIVGPFQGIVGTSVTGSNVFEWSSLIAAIVYLCIAWGLVYLLDILYPITPRDVE